MGALMREQLVSLPGGLRLRCRIENPGASLPPLVLLNGSIFNLHQWDRLVAKGGWTRRFRLIRYDYADTGGSSRRDGPVSVERLADELVALLDALELPAVHLHGISQGTIVLQGLAARAPARILSAAGYGWYHGDFSGIADTAARIEQRLVAFRELSSLWDRPLDRPAFDALWSAVHRRALFGASWEELSAWGRLKDRLMRRVLFPLLAPTPIRTMHDWFDYCVRELPKTQVWLREGHEALASKPMLVQHAIADQTLEIGMARELCAAIPGARLGEYGEGYDHVSVAFRTVQARRVVTDHLAFLDEVGAI